MIPDGSPEPDPTRSAAAALPADGHVHTQFSYDTLVGDMEATCARAVALGLPAVAFTEHAERSGSTVLAHEVQYYSEHLQPLIAENGVFTPPPLDLDGYLESVARCRDLFPGLRILTGVELGEPHWHGDWSADLVKAGGFERVLASLHSLQARGGFADVGALLQEGDPLGVVRRYLAELERLASSTVHFDVLAHVDFPLRYLPESARPFDPAVVEPEYRAALTALARSGRAMEVNTSLPLAEPILRWWRDVGGQEVTFGSDAHQPSRLARRFAEVRAMVEAVGFRPAADPAAPWRRG